MIPSGIATSRATPDSPSCVEILAHIGDLMDWVLRMVKGEPTWTNANPMSWEQEITRFFASPRVEAVAMAQPGAPSETMSRPFPDALRVKARVGSRG